MRAAEVAWGVRRASTVSLPAAGARSLDEGPAGAGTGAGAGADEPPAPVPAEVRPGEREGAEPDLDEVARLTFDAGVGADVWIELDCGARVEAVEVAAEVEGAGVARLLAR